MHLEACPLARISEQAGNPSYGCPTEIPLFESRHERNPKCGTLGHDNNLDFKNLPFLSVFTHYASIAKMLFLQNGVLKDIL
jgi:hypothetical protein